MTKYPLVISISLLFYSHILLAQNILNVSKDLKLPNTYTTIQAAVDAASAGDTIHVHPHPLSYSSATIAKKLTIVGSGYKVIDQEDSLGIKTINANPILNVITFNAGSDSSVIMGCEVSHIRINDPVKFVHIIRNMVHTNIEIWGADSITISGCYLPGVANFYSGAPYCAIGIRDSYGHYCSNNILTSEGSDNIFVSSTAGAVIQRNILMSNGNISNSIIVDNIVRSNFTSLNSTVSNNVFMANLAPYASGNLINQGSTGIFVGYPDQLTYSFDNRWQLAPGSPAIGYAFDGGDCGAFDGTNPYKLSGVPAIPLIYELTPVNDVIIENDSIHMNIKIRSEQ